MQGMIIMVMGFVLFDKLFLQVQTITFTALIIAEILNIFTTVSSSLSLAFTRSLASLVRSLSLVRLLSVSHSLSLSLHKFNELLSMLQLNRVNLMQIITCLVSITLYTIICVTMKKYLFLGDIGIMSILKLIAITAISWVPPFVIGVIRKKFLPNDYEKIMKYRK